MFNAVSTNSTTGTVEYTLLNPTTFVAAAKETGMFAVPTDESEVHSANNYINNGGWFWVEHEDYTKSDCLWGGAPFGAEGQTIRTINNKEILANNGAQPGNKSIFDPCPAGWMLPAADAWLGFTSDGLNHKGQEQLDAMNYDTTLQINKVHGLLMYMQDWKIGPTSFFPTQGWRLADRAVWPVVVGAVLISHLLPLQKEMPIYFIYMIHLYILMILTLMVIIAAL